MKTSIYKFAEESERVVGYVQAGRIYASMGTGTLEVGKYDGQGRIFRQTRHEYRELGYVTPTGEIFSHGLFEGGMLGWVEPDGVVVQGGLIFGEADVGRVEGQESAVAAAALLLLFLPEDAEDNRKMSRYS